MQPRGPLMIEHRLIEHMIEQVWPVLEQIQARHAVDPSVVDTTVDFVRVYADSTHHGKEEDILFRDLDKKDLSAKDRTVMDELVQEHVFGRETTGELVEANNRYRDGDSSALHTIAVKLRTLAEFYPKHIEKEDKVFFPASMGYLTEEEQQAMLTEFWEFDRKMIHEKYKAVVGSLEEKYDSR